MSYLSYTTCRTYPTYKKLNLSYFVKVSMKKPNYPRGRDGKLKGLGRDIFAFSREDSRLPKMCCRLWCSAIFSTVERAIIFH